MISTATNVSSSSHGTMTINFFYDFGETNTLKVTYQIVSFKPSDFWWGTYSKVQKGAYDKQMKGNIEFTERVRSYHNY